MCYYSYQGKCLHSGIWLDKCIMARQNATRESINAIVIDLQFSESSAYSPKAFFGFMVEKDIL